MRKTICLALIAFLAPGFVSGCATTDGNRKTDHEDAIVRAVAETPGAGKGEQRKTLSAGVLGVLKGGFFGNYSDRKEKELQETKQIHPGDPAMQDIRIRIETVRATPDVADPGDTIEIRVKYAVLAPQEDLTVPVHETREILFEENRVGEAAVDIEREGGTWRSSVPITLPPNARPGSYRVVVSVRIPNGAQDTEEVAFRVR